MLLLPVVIAVMIYFGLPPLALLVPAFLFFVWLLVQSRRRFDRHVDAMGMRDEPHFEDVSTFKLAMPLILIVGLLTGLGWLMGIAVIWIAR